MCGVYLLNVNFNKGINVFQAKKILVGPTGFEPVTSCLSSMRSKPTELRPQKGYKAKLLDLKLKEGVR